MGIANSENTSEEEEEEEMTMACYRSFAEP